MRVRPSRVNRLLGVEIGADAIAETFARLRFAYTKDGDDFIVTPPSYRFDLAIEEDFIEEAARLYGYEHIPSAPPVHAQTMLPERESLRPTAELRQRLVDRDYQ